MGEAYSQVSLAQWPGGGTDPRSYPPRQEGARPGALSVPQVLWSPVLAALPPPGALLGPVSGRLAIVGTLNEPAQSEASLRAQQDQRCRPAPPLLHTQLGRGLGLRQAGPLANTNPELGVWSAGREACQDFPGTRDAAWVLLEGLWAPSSALDGLAM